MVRHAVDTNRLFIAIKALPPHFTSFLTHGRQCKSPLLEPSALMIADAEPGKVVCRLILDHSPTLSVSIV